MKVWRYYCPCASICKPFSSSVIAGGICLRFSITIFLNNCSACLLGITGFDETAYFYWRRHEGQENKKLSVQGWIGTKGVFSLANNLDREGKWKIYGNNTAKYLVKKIKDDQTKIAAYWFALNFFSLRIKASMTTLRDIWFYPKFWLCLPKALLQTRNFLKQWYLLSRPILRPLLNYINRNYPELKNKSVFFNKLIKHL